MQMRGFPVSWESGGTQANPCPQVRGTWGTRSWQVKRGFPFGNDKQKGKCKCGDSRFPGKVVALRRTHVPKCEGHGAPGLGRSNADFPLGMTNKKANANAGIPGFLGKWWHSGEPMSPSARDMGHPVLAGQTRISLWE